MKVTAAMLRKLGACKDQLEVFKANWPNGANTTAATILKALRLGITVRWFAEKVLTAPALAEYNKVRAEAGAEYEKVRAEAWAEYKKVCAEAGAEYEKVCAEAWAECEKVCAEAGAAAFRTKARAKGEK